VNGVIGQLAEDGRRRGGRASHQGSQAIFHPLLQLRLVDDADVHVAERLEGLLLRRVTPGTPQPLERLALLTGQELGGELFPRGSVGCALR
jgi:hypothetical protein